MHEQWIKSSSFKPGLWNFAASLPRSTNVTSSVLLSREKAKWYFCVFYFHPQWREIFLNIFKYLNIIERLASLVTVKSFTCNTLETEVKSNHLERGGMTKSSEAMPFNHSGTCKAFHECYPTLFINLSLCAVNLQVLVSFGKFCIQSSVCKCYWTYIMVFKVRIQTVLYLVLPQPQVLQP